jgi:hypothetical protein
MAAWPETEDSWLTLSFPFYFKLGDKPIISVTYEFLASFIPALA